MCTNCHHSSRPTLLGAAMASLCLTFAGAPVATAQEIVYDNTGSFLGPRSFTQLQIGDEIHAAGDARIITKLEIGLSMQGYEGTADLQARMFANDGSGGQPGTLLWESELFDDVELTGNDDLVPFDVPDVEVGDAFTWTIQVSDHQPVAVGLPHYGPPAVGSSPDYAWFGDGSPPWTKLDLTDPVDFMCRVTAQGEGGINLAVDISSCPDAGPIQVSWDGATPGGQIAILMANAPGSFIVPNNKPCPGTTIDLSTAGIRIAFQGSAGADGSRTIGAPNVPASFCGKYLQLVDLTTCGTSNVTQIQ